MGSGGAIAATTIDPSSAVVPYGVTPPVVRIARSWPRHILELCEKLSEALVGLAILVELLLLFGNTIAKAAAGVNYAWTSEVAQIALAVMMWIGTPLALRKRLHVSLNLVTDRVPPALASVFKAATGWFIAVTSAGLLLVLEQAISQDWGVTTPVLGLPESVYLFPAPVGLLLAVAFAIEDMDWAQKRLVLSVGGIMIAIIAILFATSPHWSNGISSSAILITTSVIAVLGLLAGVPIAFVLVGVPFFYLKLTLVAPLSTVVLRLQDSSQQVVLSTIPFFVLAGALMASGGLARRLSDMITSMVGHFRGGLYYVLVVFMFFFSGMSGSKAADIAAVGKTMAGPLGDASYLPSESAACLAASGAMYETVPPSVTLLVVSSITGISLASLFLAGILPAIILGACTMVWIFARRKHYAMESLPRASWLTRGKAVLNGVPALLLPIILVGGTVSGIGDPTEVSSFAVVYAFLAGLIFDRRKSLRNFWGSVKEAAALTGMVLFIVAAADAFSWVLTVSGFPQELASWLSALNGSSVGFLLLSVVALVAMGAILEGLPAIVIFAPLLIPVASRMGISSLHYAIILVLAMGLGFFLPSIGVGSYIAAGIVKAKMDSMIRPLLGYSAVLFAALLVIALIPSVSLAIPNVFNVH